MEVGGLLPLLFRKFRTDNANITLCYSTELVSNSQGTYYAKE